MSLLASSRETSRRTFERWSTFYDSSACINSYLEKWDREIVKMPLSPPILDMGCGPGRLINKLLGAGRSDIHGIDLTLSGLRIANTKARTSAFRDDSYSFTEALIEQLPFHSESFQTIILSGVFHHLENPGPALSEAARILRDRGTFLVADPYFPPLMRHFINAVLCLYPVTGDRKFYSAPAITALAERYGFRKKAVHPLPLAYILTFEKCCN